jgi:hypothetical protein
VPQIQRLQLFRAFKRIISGLSRSASSLKGIERHEHQKSRAKHRIGADR